MEHHYSNRVTGRWSSLSLSLSLFSSSSYLVDFEDGVIARNKRRLYELRLRDRRAHRLAHPTLSWPVVDEVLDEPLRRLTHAGVGKHAANLVQVEHAVLVLIVRVKHELEPLHSVRRDDRCQRLHQLNEIYIPAVVQCGAVRCSSAVQ